MNPQETQYRARGIYGPGILLFEVAVILQIFVFLALAVRLYSRRITRCGVDVDDWIITGAVALDTVLTAVVVTGVFYGYGVPVTRLSPSDMMMALKMFYLIQIIYKMAIGCCKLSFCFFYFRIFPSSNRTFRRVNIALIICIVLYSVASVGSTIFQCRPMARIWDKSVTGHCINFTAFWYTNGAYNVTTDLLIIIIPIAVCCKLQIKKGEMIGLCLIFSVGIFVIITSVLRITTLDISSKATDPISGTLISTTWTSVETHASIIVACLPAFKAPIGRIWNRLVPCSRSGQSTRTVNHMEVIGRRSSRPDPLLEFAGLGNIAVMTDVEVEYEHKSRGSSSVNFNQQRLSMDA